MAKKTHLALSAGNADALLRQTVVNDSGVYLPPSPTEEKSAWPRRYLTTASRSSSDSRGNSGEIEHFSISRESFDSYRRSFVSRRCRASPAVTGCM